MSDKSIEEKLRELSPYVAYYNDVQELEELEDPCFSDYLDHKADYPILKENPIDLAYTELEDSWGFEHEVQVSYDADLEAYVYEVEGKSFYEPVVLEEFKSFLEFGSSQSFEHLVYDGLKCWEKEEYGDERSKLSLETKQKILAPHLQAYKNVHFDQASSFLYEYKNGLLECPKIHESQVGLETVEDLEEWNREGSFHFVESWYDLEREEILHYVDEDLVKEPVSLEALLERLDEASFDEITFCRDGLDLWEKEVLPGRLEKEREQEPEIGR